MSIPLVTICIPTYNYGIFISDAIKSVLAQTFSDFELFVIDNYSMIIQVISFGNIVIWIRGYGIVSIILRLDGR